MKLHVLTKINPDTLTVAHLFCRLIALPSPSSIPAKAMFGAYLQFLQNLRLSILEPYRQKRVQPWFEKLLYSAI